MKGFSIDYTNTIGSFKTLVSDIMTNTGFGLLRYMKDGVVITIPPAGINQATGLIKPAWKRHIDNLTIGNVEWLFSKGCEITVSAAAA